MNRCLGLLCGWLWLSLGVPRVHAEIARHPVREPAPLIEPSRLWMGLLGADHGALPADLEAARGALASHDAPTALKRLAHVTTPDATTLLLRAVALEATQQWAACADAYAQALRAEPQMRETTERPRGPVSQGYAVCLAQLGQFAEAARELRTFSAQHPEALDARMHLAEAYLAQERLDLARAVLGGLATQATYARLALVKWRLVLAHALSGNASLERAWGEAAFQADRVLLQLRQATSTLLPQALVQLQWSLAYEAAARREPTEFHNLPKAVLAMRAAQRAWPAKLSPLPTERLRELEPRVAAALERQLAGAPATLRTISKLVPTLRACIEATPLSLYEVSLTSPPLIHGRVALSYSAQPEPGRAQQATVACMTARLAEHGVTVVDPLPMAATPQVTWALFAPAQ